MAYSDFDLQFSSRVQSDANVSGGDMVSPPAGIPYQNAALSSPLTATGEFCRAIQHNGSHQTEASVGQVKLLLANTGSVSAQPFYDVDRLNSYLSARMYVRMGLAEGTAAASEDNFLSMVGLSTFTSGSDSLYSGGYELVLQAKGSGASRSVGVVLRASQPQDFSGGVPSLLAARTVACSGSYSLDAWYHLRLDVVPTSTTRKTLIAYSSADAGDTWSEIGRMVVRASDAEWSNESPNRTGVVSLRCGEPEATEFYNHFIDGLETRSAPRVVNNEPVGSVVVSGSYALGQELTATVSFTDAEGVAPDTTVYQWMRGTEQIAGANALTYVVQAADQNQELSLEVRYTDNAGNAEVLASVPVLVSNTPPSLDNELSDQEAFVGLEFSYTVPADAFSDFEGDTLTYSASLADDSALPAWLSFDAATRTFAGTPPDVIEALDLKVIADDGNATASDVFSLNIRARVGESFEEWPTSETLDSTFFTMTGEIAPIFQSGGAGPDYYEVVADTGDSGYKKGVYSSLAEVSYQSENGGYYQFSGLYSPDYSDLGYIQFSENDFDNLYANTSITFEAWVQRQDPIFYILQTQTDTLNLDHAALFYMTETAIGVTRPNNSSNYLAASFSSNANEWYHLAAVVQADDQTQSAVYVNGQAVSVTNSNFFHAQQSLLGVKGIYLGYGTSGSGPFTGAGKLAFARSYRRALTSSEVLENFISTKDRFGL